MNRLSRFSKNQLKKLMPSTPKSFLNTNKVNATKTSQLPRKTSVKVNLLKRNVPAVTLRNTSVKIALTKKRFAFFARLMVTLKLLAERKKQNKKKRMTLLITWRKNVKIRKSNIAQVRLLQHHHYIYDYPLQQENIK